MQVQVKAQMQVQALQVVANAQMQVQLLKEVLETMKNKKMMSRLEKNSLHGFGVTSQGMS
jgi:predicted transcriptional regulator